MSENDGGFWVTEEEYIEWDIAKARNYVIVEKDIMKHMLRVKKIYPNKEKP